MIPWYSLPSRRSKWTFWIGAPFVAVTGYVLLDLLLNSLKVYQQGAVQWDGVDPNGLPTGGSFSLLLGHRITMISDIAIMAVLMLFSAWLWLLAVKRLLK